MNIISKLYLNIDIHMNIYTYVVLHSCIHYIDSCRKVSVGISSIPWSVFAVTWNLCAGARTFSESSACPAWHPRTPHHSVSLCRGLCVLFSLCKTSSSFCHSDFRAGANPGANFLWRYICVYVCMSTCIYSYVIILSCACVVQRPSTEYRLVLEKLYICFMLGGSHGVNIGIHIPFETVSHRAIIRVSQLYDRYSCSNCSKTISQVFLHTPNTAYGTIFHYRVELCDMLKSCSSRREDDLGWLAIDWYFWDGLNPFAFMNIHKPCALFSGFVWSEISACCLQNCY